MPTDNLTTKNTLITRDPHRQAKVWKLVLTGISNAEIAAVLNIKIATVKMHVNRILKANNVKPRAALIAKSTLKLEQN